MKINEHFEKKDRDVSIVVVNYNTTDLLGDTLESIVATADNVNYEVMVIDNASSDGGFSCVDDTFKQNPRFLFIQNEKNVGLSAFNTALRLAQGKYILTLDPDARLHNNTLKLLFDFMETHIKVGAATANLLNEDGSLQLYYRRTLTPSLFFFTTLFGRFIDKYLLGLRYFNYFRYIDLDTTKISELEQPPVTCLMLRREALGEYIVDDRLAFYFMDVDISRRLYDAGYSAYLVPKAFATHLKSMSYSRVTNAWRQRKYYEGLSVYLYKHYPYWFPLLWILMWSDRALRVLLTRIIGREVLR